MVSEGVELLHVVQNRGDRVVVYREAGEEETSHSYELQSYECCDWSPKVRLSEWDLDAVITLFRSAQEILKSSRSRDE